jgi:peptidoglycan/xylan/chitin deacetylase (PgdA/CDA1 family)
VTAVHAITFDNLGEVTELARGEHPEGEPLGRHHSVTRALPRILAALEETGLRATFFVEGLNTELYPETLATIAAAGHELAFHGWCHEQWAALGPQAERELFDRGASAFGALGLPPAGFRPPGGELTAASARLLREHGFTYCSPAGDVPEARDGLAILPFAWPLVDAYHYLPRFASLRGADAPHPPAAHARELTAALERPWSAAVFHAFLSEPGERFAVLRAHLAEVRERIDRGALVSGPCRELAAHVSSSPCRR